MSATNEPRVYTITWNELGKWLKKGMQMIHITQGPGAETSMLAIVPEELVEELERRPRKSTNKKPSLKELLADMAGWAAMQPGEPRRFKLGGGLGIDLIWGIDGMWRLQIWREGKQPSLKEWETCLKAWPEPVPDGVQVQRFVHGNRAYMRGEWKAETNGNERMEAEQKGNLRSANPGTEEPGDRSGTGGSGDENSSVPAEAA